MSDDGTEIRSAVSRKRVLVLLGARMERTRGPDHWRFPLFLEELTEPRGYFPGEVSGGSSRMRAVQAVHQRSQVLGNDELLVLVTGGDERDGRSRADEAARQLVWRYGLPEDAVLSIQGAGSTIGNAAATAEYISRNRHVFTGNRPIEIVTNDYHMLRAWILFSKQMRDVTVTPEWTAPPPERECIREILIDGLPEKQGWSPSRIKVDRERVMSILRPHFSGTPEIVPLVVEEILEHESRRDSGPRYARRLRNNDWVRRTLCLEYERLMKLLGSELNCEHSKTAK